MIIPELIGIPFDAYSSFLRGAAAAPSLIRKAFHSDASNSWTETGLDLSAPNVLTDAGDLTFPADDQVAFSLIEEGITKVLAREHAPITLGGDHSITYPIVKSLSRKYPKLTIVHFDAHPDLYQEFQGNPHSHACPFARIMANNLASRLIQIGIRTLNAHQREQASRFGVEQYEMRNLPPRDLLKLKGPIYVSFDMDALDPAFAPGVSHREPGGLSVREALQYIHAINGTVVGADIVEYNPVRDLDGVTAVVAAKLLKEVAGLIIGAVQ